MARLCDVDGACHNVDISSRGVGLLSKLHLLAEEGGVHAVLAFRLFAHSCRPYLSMIRRWVFSGWVADPYQEFGVTDNELDKRGASSPDWWGQAFSVRTGQAMPSFLASQLHQLLDTGKVINLLKSCGLPEYGQFCELLPEVQLVLVETSEQLQLVSSAFLEVNRMQAGALADLKQSRAAAVEAERRSVQAGMTQERAVMRQEARERQQQMERELLVAHQNKLEQRAELEKTWAQQIQDKDLKHQEPQEPRALSPLPGAVGTRGWNSWHETNSCLLYTSPSPRDS
eukprot:TRINITY_DN8146_c0_g1_i2.p1 TRINITY_DN8146_c0_g1~~TRINITY_DN8146_c0_g1_i2.p1  ORF type:complete len:285 (-),score=83.57 TRINITY_DN8146_c0_g1_i2:56-910(-)